MEKTGKNHVNSKHSTIGARTLDAPTMHWEPYAFRSGPGPLPTVASLLTKGLVVADGLLPCDVGVPGRSYPVQEEQGQRLCFPVFLDPECAVLMVYPVSSDGFTQHIPVVLFDGVISHIQKDLK